MSQRMSRIIISVAITTQVYLVEELVLNTFKFYLEKSYQPNTFCWMYVDLWKNKI